MNIYNDTYLEALYMERELHQLTQQYANRFDPKTVERAKQLQAECEERIKLREYILAHGLQ